MTTKKAQDIAFGLNSEEEMINILNAKFNTNVIKLDTFNPFDFETKTRLIELKSRKNLSSKYPTTMIGDNKIIEAEKQNKKVYFVFKFTDKIKYIRYNKSRFDKFQRRVGGRSDRNCIESNTYCYIPIDELKNL